MKVKFFAVAACLMLLSFVGKAQSLIIGYVQVEKIFAEWPETKTSNTELQEYEAQLNTRLQAKVQDFQTKYAAYQQNGPSMDAITRQDTETELQNLQSSIQKFEANAQQSISQKNLTLLKPLQDKLKQTIDQVAKENGYTHVFTYGTSLVYTSDKSGDISAKVASKLGFTLSADTE